MEATSHNSEQEGAGAEPAADSQRVEDLSGIRISTTRLRRSGESGDEPGLPAPRVDGVAGAVEQARVFEALFEMPAQEQKLGRYVVLGTLGQGGMGVVLEAFDRTLDRRVAVKVLHKEFDERQTARLLREAQAMAKLSHPNVVQVFEAGEFEGQTFVVMELVQGKTLHQWIRQEPRPSWRECVEVFCQAGKGLAAAHARGLVHRDFKPGNAIVDEEGRPRVLDFGLARTVDSDSEHRGTPSIIERARSEEDNAALDNPLTKTGAILGTPAYMPPEQVKGAEADARSDQFSFCVALYEAVYGERPFEGTTMMALMVSMTAEQVRPAPKGIDVPARLRTVLLRGLAVDPDERWGSMEDLLAELHELVAPRARRWLALGMTAGLAALGGGLALSQYMEVKDRCTGAPAQLDGIWDDDRRQQVKAAILGTELVYAPGTWDRVEQGLDDYTEVWTDKHTEVCEATRVTEEQTDEEMSLRMGCLRKRKTSLNAVVKVLAAADAEANATVVENAVEMVAGLPGLTRCDDVDWLAEHNQRVPPPEDPKVAAEVEQMREQLAYIDAGLRAGKYAPTLQQAESAVDRAEALEYGPLLAEAKFWRGRLRASNGLYAEAEQDLREAYAQAAEQGHDEVEMKAAGHLAFVVGGRLARQAEGMQWGFIAVPLAKRSGEESSVAASLGHQGSVLSRHGKYEEAEARYRRALEMREEALGEDHPGVAATAVSLGSVLADQGKHEEAEAHYRRALGIWEKAVGPDHPHVATGVNNLGIVLSRQGKYKEAEAAHRRALEIKERVLDERHPDVAASVANLGAMLDRQGKVKESEEYHRRALELMENTLGEAHPDVAAAVDNLGIALVMQGRHEEAEAYFRRALGIRESALGEDHVDVAISTGNLVHALSGQGQYEEAEAYCRRSLKIKENVLSEDHPDMARGLDSLGVVLGRQGKYEEAETYFRRSLKIKENVLDESHPDIASSMDSLGNALNGQGKYEEAESYFRKSLQIMEDVLDEDHPNVAGSLTNLGHVLMMQGQYQEASECLRRGLGILENVLGKEHPLVAHPLMGLAQVGLAQGDSEAARSHAERAVSILEGGTATPEHLAQARFLLARALWSNTAERERARALARQSREAFAAMGTLGESEESLAEIEVWLAKRQAR